MLLLQGILYSLDSVFWMFSIHTVLVGIFRYPFFWTRKRAFAAGICAVLFTAINIVLNHLALKYIGSGTAVLGFSALWIFVFWMFCLEEKKKLRRFFVANIAFMLVQTMIELIFAFTELMNPFLGSAGSASAQAWIMIADELILMAVFWLLSRVLSAERKDPLPFSVILGLFLISFLVKVILELVSSHFWLEEEGVTKHYAFFAVIRIGMKDGISGEMLEFSITLLLLVFFLIFIIMLLKNSDAAYFQRKSALNESYLEAQKEHYETLLKSDREVRKLRHDMKNHVYVISELQRRGEQEKLREYLSDLTGELEMTGQVVYTGNEIADAIIAEKKRKAGEIGAEIAVSGSLTGADLKSIDICTIFANVLDNAIEAVGKIGMTERSIVLSVKSSGNFLLISEENLTDAPLFKGESLPSTKKNAADHGLGIANVRSAAAKYDGEVSVSISQRRDAPAGADQLHLFRIEIMIPV